MTIRLLQGLRAFAALLVVMHHAQHEAAALAARAGVAFMPSTALPWPAGVDIFFVISGFIIVHASAALYGEAGGRRRFLAHRVTRVVPLYWLVTAGYLALALTIPDLLSGDTATDRLDPAYVVASFLFWPMARADGVPVPLYGLGWTLNCEMFFYGLFAVGLGWGRRPAIAWLVASLALLAAARAAFPDMPMPLAFWTSPIILEFALGALLALARDEGFRLGRAWQVVLAVAGLAILAALPEPSLALHPLSYGLPAAMLVAACALGPDVERGNDAGPKRLLVGGMVALGNASYALYLTHPFVLRAGREAVLRLGLAPSLGPWGALAITVILACLVSVALYRLIEKPLTRRARALLDPRGGAARQKPLDADPVGVSGNGKRI